MTITKSVLVMGSTGLLGNAVFQYLSQDCSSRVYGTIRQPSDMLHFSESLRNNLVVTKDLLELSQLAKVIKSTSPEIVINCIAPSRLSNSDLSSAFHSYSLFPRRLHAYLEVMGIRYIHISSDGVFSGTEAPYGESDLPDAQDIYGSAKYLGEPQVGDYVCLRTSVIGHEIKGKHGLLEWFLSQDEALGYSDYYFTGTTSLEVAKFLLKIINSDYRGILNFGGIRISKFDLLKRIVETYGLKTKLSECKSRYIDRSLDLTKANTLFKHPTKDWDTALVEMREFYRR